jgi:hypothetical protein
MKLTPHVSAAHRPRITPSTSSPREQPPRPAPEIREPIHEPRTPVPEERPPAREEPFAPGSPHETEPARRPEVEPHRDPFGGVSVRTPRG